MRRTIRAVPLLIPPILLLITLAWWARAYFPRDFRCAADSGSMLLIFTEGYWERRINATGYTSSWGGIWAEGQKHAQRSWSVAGLAYASGPGTPNNPASRYAMIAIPFAYPAGLLAAASAWSMVAIMRRRRIGPNSCGKCGYDLTGNTSGTCPECGTAVKT
jgi:hypothetical protein